MESPSQVGNCPTCGGAMAASAKTCPHCGHERRGKGQARMALWMTLIFLALLLLALIYFQGTIK
jgi:predicted nucleic acid-binding Zn ribbon protein